MSDTEIIPVNPAAAPSEVRFSDFGLSQDILRALTAVSYTHLTLPTILLV